MTRSTWQNSVRKVSVILAVLALTGVGLLAQERLPDYHTEKPVSGNIRIWGHGNSKHGAADPLLAAWEQGFRKHQPGVHFETQLYGNASAIGGLYTGAADMVFLTREIEPTEVDGYEQALGHKPLQVSVLTGSVDIRDHDPAVVIFVHKDNPLTTLNLTQLDAIFGADHRHGAKNIRLWGELGLTGEWADKPIQVYGYDIDSDISHFFEQRVMGGSEKWNCDLREASDVTSRTGGLMEEDEQIPDALAKDRYGIAISNLSHKNPRTKSLAVAVEEGGASYAATKDAVEQRKYPLARPISVFIDRTPGQPVNALVKEFISYILSPEGQATAAQVSGYLPLTPELSQLERRKLE